MYTTAFARSSLVCLSLVVAACGEEDEPGGGTTTASKFQFACEIELGEGFSTCMDVRADGELDPGVSAEALCLTGTVRSAPCDPAGRIGACNQLIEAGPYSYTTIVHSYGGGDDAEYVEAQRDACLTQPYVVSWTDANGKEVSAEEEPKDSGKPGSAKPVEGAPFICSHFVGKIVGYCVNYYGDTTPSSRQPLLDVCDSEEPCPETETLSCKEEGCATPARQIARCDFVWPKKRDPIWQVQSLVYYDRYVQVGQLQVVGDEKKARLKEGCESSEDVSPPVVKKWVEL